MVANKLTPPWITIAIALSLPSWLTIGCTAPAIRSQSPEPDEIVVDTSSTQLVEEFCKPVGLSTLAVESIGLVVNLDGTGSDPPPSSRRAVLMNEMKTYRVHQPNRILESPNTSLVLVRAFLPPGIQKSDPIDVEVRVPSKSTTKSLANGLLMKTRLREMAVLNDRIATGNEMAIAKGHVLVDAQIDGSGDDVLMTRGRVLGGGVSTTSRPIGLAIRSEHHSAQTSARIGGAINSRFHTYRNGQKRGVATAKTNKYIELQVHPQYHDSIVRYVHVVQSIPVRESIGARAERMVHLKEEILNSATSLRAARRLEALGQSAAPVLLSALQSDDEEVRFYAAEALAFLNNESAVPVLADTARRLPPFRKLALIALKAMEVPQAYDELAKLIHVESAETRYGAFRALREISPNDPLVGGENLNGTLMLHCVSSTSSPMVHISRQRRPEIVVFGNDLPLRMPLVVFAGEEIIVKGDTGDRLKVTRFSSKPSDDQQVICDATVDEMIRAIVSLDGYYPEVVQAIVQAHRQGVLDCRVEFDALPELGRVYHRESKLDSDAEIDENDNRWQGI